MGLASFTSDSYSPKQLLAGGFPARSKKVTILTGQNLVEGSVLGRITKGTATAAAKSGGNTGNGTCTVDETTPVKAGAKVGVYAVRFTIAATNNGTFIVTDPDGFQIGTVVMAAGAGAFDNDIKFAIADGSTDFAVGDGFDITVAAGSGKYILSLAAAVDGSEVPDAILAHDMDATSADKEAMVYVAAAVNVGALTIGTGHTAAGITEGLRAKGIHLVDSIAMS